MNHVEGTAPTSLKIYFLLNKVRRLISFRVLVSFFLVRNIRGRQKIVRTECRAIESSNVGGTQSKNWKLNGQLQFLKLCVVLPALCKKQFANRRMT
jgi:hypothetical protein